MDSSSHNDRAAQRLDSPGGYRSNEIHVARGHTARNATRLGPAASADNPNGSHHDVSELVGRRVDAFIVNEPLRGWDVPGGGVFKAHHVHLDQEFALLVLLDSGDPATLRRFWHQARILVRLHHRHIVRTHLAGQDVVRPPGFRVQWVAMEPRKTRTIADLAERSGSRLSATAVAEIGRQTLDALAHAHERGVIHTAIQPSAIRISRSGTTRLFEFGDAMVKKGLLDTRDARIPGALAFRAPEQWERPDRVNERTDLHGIGATMWALLVGRPPFAGSTESVIRANACEHDPPSAWSEADVEVDRQLSAFIDRLIARDPSGRPGSAREAADELAKWIARDSSSRTTPLARPSRLCVGTTDAHETIRDGRVGGSLPRPAQPARLTVTLAIRSGPRFVADLTSMLESVAVQTRCVDSIDSLAAMLRVDRTHVVLLDPDLDDYRDGIEATSSICHRWPETSVILYSDRCNPGDATRGLLNGACQYLNRPASAVQVVDVICKVLGIDPARVRRTPASDTVEWKPRTEATT